LLKRNKAIITAKVRPASAEVRITVVSGAFERAERLVIAPLTYASTPNTKMNMRVITRTVRNLLLFLFGSNATSSKRVLIDNITIFLTTQASTIPFNWAETRRDRTGARHCPYIISSTHKRSWHVIIYREHFSTANC